MLAGETTDESISPDTTVWLKEYSGDEHAEFLDAANYKARKIRMSSSESNKNQYRDFTASKIVIVYDLYLVEADGKWMFGSLEEDGLIDCWNEFDSLEEAIDALQTQN